MGKYVYDNKAIIIIVFLLYVHYTVHPEINSKAQFGTNNATVTLEWSQEAGVTYNVSVAPKMDVNFIDNTAVKLIGVAYNVGYNVSIVSILCGRNSTTTRVQLSYGESPTKDVSS